MQANNTSLVKKSIILIIPCFNEEKRINSEEYLNFLKNHPDIALIFVNDGSTDNTLRILEKLSDSTENITFLNLEKNKGKGEAVRKGFIYSQSKYEYDFIGFTDADLSTPLVEFENFLSIFKANPQVNIVMGSRVQMLGKNISRNIYRHWFGRIIATLICKILNEAVYDTQCGAKLFRSKYSEALFINTFISKWLFDVEILARYKNQLNKSISQTIIECPVNSWIEKEGSKLKYHYIFRIILDLLKIRQYYFKRHAE